MESLFWVPVSDELPDDEITVLVNHPTLNEPVWLGYYEQGHWYTPNGEALPDGSVTHWADMPSGKVAQ